MIRKGNDDVRFQGIVRDLGHNRATVRITAFYRFLYLAEKKQDTYQKTKKLRQDIFEILCGCLRGMSSKTLNVRRDKHKYQIERQALFDILFKGKFRGDREDKKNFVPSKFFTDLHMVYLAKLDLSGANLLGVILSGANLSGADLSGADLSGANLSDADLSGADLSGANLSGTNLLDADFSRANLSRVTLSNTNLSGAVFSGADFSGTIFSNANPSKSDLSNTDLSDTDLLKTDLSNANLQKAQLKGANLHDVSSIEQADFRGAKIGDRDITENDIPKDKGEYYADWTDSPPAKPDTPQKLQIAPAKSGENEV